MAEEKLDGSDWLYPDAEKNKAATAVAALKFASLYLIFEKGDGKTLLAHWLKEVENRDLAPNSSHAEYAYWEGRRAFIRGIQRQIELAHNRGALPQ